MSDSVFFSFLSQDLQDVGPMLDSLERLDIDQRGPIAAVRPSSISIQEMESREIELSKLLVLFLTDAAITSDEASRHVQAACAFNVDIVVLQLTSFALAEPMKGILESAQWIDARGLSPEEAAERLASVICERLGFDPQARKASSALPDVAFTGTVEEQIAAMKKVLAEVPPAPSFMRGSEPVFFCYSDFDLRIVGPMLDELERLDIDSRACYTRVPPHEGNAAADILREDIESSKLMVVFLTDGVVFSSLIKWQIQTAISYGLDTVAVRLTSNEPEESLRDALESAYWIDALGRPLEDVTNQLVDVVRARLGLDPHAPKASSALPDVAFTGTADEMIAAMRKILTEEPPASSES